MNDSRLLRHTSRPTWRSWLLAKANRRNRSKPSRTTEPDTSNSDRLTRLRETIGRSGTLTHANFLAYLALLIYFFVAVTSTTHEDLLRVTPKAVPLLNIQLPLWWFFLTGPIALVIIHLNLLIQYYYLAQNLSRYDTAITQAHGKANCEGSREERDMTANFLLVNLHLDSDMPWLLRGLMHVALWSFTAVAPLVLLLLFQYYFLPYHSEFVTWMQRAAFVFSAGMLLYLWPRIISGNSIKSISHQSDPLALSLWPLSNTNPKLPRLLKADSYTILLISLFGCLGSLFILTIPEESLDFYWAHQRPRSASEWRNLTLPDKLLLKAEPPAELLAQYAKDIDGYEPALIRLIEQQKLGLDLRGRDLRHANFAHSRLYSVSLQDAILHDIDLEGVKLQGATLVGAEMYNAKLLNAELQGANLTAAKIKGANLLYAMLNHANLQMAELQSIALIGAELQNANLFMANLSDAYLAGANLQYASLRGANLKNARLEYAELQGADLSEADLQGSILFEAKLQGANLIGANLQGADLSKSELQGALLQRTRLQGANLTGTKLQGADLTGARLQGAQLINAELQGAVLNWAKLQAVDLTKAILTGVIAINADFRDTLFLPQSVNLCDFRSASFGPMAEKEWNQLKVRILQELPEHSHKAIEDRLDLLHLKASADSQPATQKDICFGTAQYSVCDESILERIYKTNGSEKRLASCNHAAAANQIYERMLGEVYGNINQSNYVSLEAFLNTTCPIEQSVDEEILSTLSKVLADAKKQKGVLSSVGPVNIEF